MIRLCLRRAGSFLRVIPQVRLKGRAVPLRRFGFTDNCLSYMIHLNNRMLEVLFLLAMCTRIVIHFLGVLSSRRFHLVWLS